MKNIVTRLWKRMTSSAGVEPAAPPPDNERVLIEIFDFLQRDRRAARWRRAFMVFGLALFMLAPLILYVAFNLPDGLFSTEKKLGYVRVEGIVGVRGGVDPDQVIKGLRRAFESRAVAVALKIDSPGGSPYTADRIVAVIDQLVAEHPDKPLYAVVERTGASAAYMIAMHAREIWVSPYSAVGSIGAILTSWDFHELSRRYDVDRHVFASGSLKGMLDPFKPITDSEAQKAQAIVDAIGATFADEVIAQRGERLKMPRAALTTGEIWVGKEAIAHGLADNIGTLDTLARKLDAIPFDMSVRQNPLRSGASALAADLANAFLAALEQPWLH